MPRRVQQLVRVLRHRPELPLPPAASCVVPTEAFSARRRKNYTIIVYLHFKAGASENVVDFPSPGLPYVYRKPATTLRSRPVPG